jgi:dihydroorotate dehydrogenase electron transfer subunit
MPNLHAEYYADSMVQVDAAIERNDLIGESTYLLRVSAASIAARVVPGQFVMIRIKGTDAPLIGRALAVYDVVQDESGAARWLDLVYLRKGTLTTALAAAALGTNVTLWGPLGNGFSNRPCDHLIMTAGGIGQTPMLVLGREALGSQSFGQPARQSGWSTKVELIYGARRKSLLAGVDDFQQAGFDVTLCTDDGSAGQKKLVPEVLRERLAAIGPGQQRVRVVTCGPEIMMEKVAEVCSDASVDCQVSMETPMACGIGICFSCVARVRQSESEWDYKRTCVEGPIFDADKICW